MVFSKEGIKYRTKPFGSNFLRRKNSKESLNLSINWGLLGHKRYFQWHYEQNHRANNAWEKRGHIFLWTVSNYCRFKSNYWVKKAHSYSTRTWLRKDFYHTHNGFILASKAPRALQTCSRCGSRRWNQELVPGKNEYILQKSESSWKSILSRCQFWLSICSC